MQTDQEQIVQIRAIVMEELSKRLPIQRATVDGPEAAKYLGISHYTLMEDVRAGNIPHVKLRGRYVFRLSTLDEFMAEKERSSLRQQEDLPLEEYLPQNLKRVWRAK